MLGCGVLTAGPSDESHDAVVNVGIAAHIHAAAPNGRRYDQNMKAEERKDIRNGIWLCGTHSIEIDRNDVRYTPDVLRRMKAEHEQKIATELNAGRGSFRGSDLIAIGPDIVGVGELLGTSGREWSVRIDHFVEGDLRSLIEFSEHFDKWDPYDRYLIVNALGDGRQLSRNPSWRRIGTSVEVTCGVEVRFPRIDAQKLGSTFATNSANDLFTNKGDIALVSGLNALPQRIKDSLSMLRGESPFNPKAGSRIKEYFDAFEGSPWLQRWVKLDVIRMACVPYQDRVLKTAYTMLQSVLHVDEVEQLDMGRAEDWLKFRFKLDVQGVGPWEQEIPIFVPHGDVPPRPPIWDELVRDC